MTAEQSTALVPSSGKYNLRLEKQSTSWLDGKILWEYHPDPLVFKATAIHPEVDTKITAHRKKMEEAGCPRAIGTGKEEIGIYMSKYEEKIGAKPVLHQKAKHKYGRARSQDWCCMATMERTIRTTLWKDFYADLDIENAQPVILEQILRGHIDTPHLRHYNAHRDETLAYLMEKYSVDRDEAKGWITAIFFGQPVPKVREPLLKSLIDERNGVEGVAGWASVLIDANPHIYESARQKNMAKHPPENRTFKHINTTTAWILQELEYRLFCAVFEWCEAEGLLTAPNVPELAGKPVCSYIYDGGCVLISAIEAWGRRTRKGVEDMLTSMREVGFAKTGLLVNWKLKEWGKHYDITELYLDLKTRPKTALLVENPEMPDEEYRRIWESNHLKIVLKGVYIEERPEGEEPIIMDEGTLIKCYGHLWNGWTEGKNPQKKNWLKTWLYNNHTIRCKEGMDIYPNPALCPSNMYNLWVPFPLTLKKTWVQNDKAVEFFVNHIRSVMCPDGEAQATYFLDWIAHMIQRPEEKVGKCPIFTSRGGVGKGRTIEMFKALLGEDKVYDPEKPERDVWGEFNGGMKNAFLVVLDELASHKTTKALGELKHIITEPKISIRLMRTDPFKMKSHHRVLANTNDEDAGVEIGQDNRRFWVNRASEKYRGNTQYWNEFDAYLGDVDAMKSVFEYFRAREITSDFRNPDATPLTAYHKALVRENTPSVDLWVEHLARENWVERERGNPNLTWTAEDTLKRYLTWCEQTSNKPETEAPNKLSRLLSMREYGLCGASVAGTGVRGKATRTFSCDKLIAYFKKTGVMTDEQYGVLGIADEDPARNLAIANEVERKMRAQQERALVAKISKDISKKVSGEAKRKMVEQLKKSAKKVIQGDPEEVESEDDRPVVSSRAPSRLPTRPASPVESEDDMSDLE